MEYVHYGCHWTAPNEWRNFDASPTLRFEQFPLIGRFYTKNDSRFPENVEYGDIVKGLPVADDSCKAIYCSHVLEHLSLEDCRRALMNTFKLLEKGGTFRFVLPDLEFYIKRYLNDQCSGAAVSFMKRTGLGQVTRNRSLSGSLISWLGNSQHLWMWDYDSIQLELEKAGFREIRRAEFGDSKDDMFTMVEDENRWINCLGVTCAK